MIEFKEYTGHLECPSCKTKTKINLSAPVIENGKINIEKEIFCSNRFCEARLFLHGNFVKKKKDTEGTLKIDRFLFNGEEKDQAVYWQMSN